MELQISVNLIEKKGNQLFNLFCYDFVSGKKKYFSYFCLNSNLLLLFYVISQEERRNEISTFYVFLISKWRYLK